MKMLSYSAITAEQRKLICNGCGSKGGWIKVPNFLFKASCNQHDFYYWRGGTNNDRKLADRAFYKFMRKDANDSSFIFVPINHALALSYYLAVRAFGKKHFYFGKMRTIKDIEKLEASV